MLVICLVTPYGYQVRHPWHWLTYGQNSSAVQTVAAVIAASAATAAGIYAARAYGAANKQVELVRLQLDLQRTENAQAELRYREEKARWEQERQDSKAREKARYAELIATEEALRPRFVNTSGFSPGTAQRLSLKNYGKSAAIDVQFISPVSNNLISRGDYVAPDTGLSGTFNVPEMLIDGVIITFKNERGTQWKIKYVLNSPGGGDEVLEVRRPWAETQ